MPFNYLLVLIHNARKGHAKVKATPRKRYEKISYLHKTLYSLLNSYSYAIPWQAYRGTKIPLLSSRNIHHFRKPNRTRNASPWGLHTRGKGSQHIGCR